MSVTKPIVLDETFIAKMDELIAEISAPSATNVSVDATGMDVITATNAQGALKQLDTAVDSVSSNLAKFHYANDTSCTINSSGLINLSQAFAIPADAYDINVQFINSTYAPTMVVKWTNTQWYVFALVAGSGDSIVRPSSGSVVVRCSWRTP